jgi:hypothetical protein
LARALLNARAMPTPIASARRLGSALVLAGLALTGLGFSNGIREDELECEEAIAHIQGCCPGFTAQEAVCLHSEGCEEDSPPLLDLGQSRCIQDLECGRVRASYCSGANTMTGAESDAPAVCP